LSFLYSLCPLRVLHSFPTRRSSDLAAVASFKRRLHVARLPLALANQLQGADHRPHLIVQEGARIGANFNQIAVARHIEAIERLQDRKSTRLNSSHRTISYAVFCLKK